MKFLHLADLHIGKRLNEFNLIEDQKYVLEQILTLAKDEEVDGVLIAGDVYDRSQPTAEAVGLLDDFLASLSDAGLSVLMISGNHDSPERLSFGSRILQKNGLHIAGTFNGHLETVTLEDEHGPLHIYLMPFLKPAQVRAFFEQKIDTYHQAIEAVLGAAQINPKERNILVAHQFVVHADQEPLRSDSESTSVGGLDSVEAFLFADFDYVALGHLHRPQQIGLESIRYGGSPLKYSFSEATNRKTVTIVDLGPKGDLTIKQHPLMPLRDLREIKGPLVELLRFGKEDPNGAQDYLRITLTDEEEIYDALGQLRLVYPNLMVLELENSRTGAGALSPAAATGELVKRNPLDLFAAFYELQNNSELTPEQIQVLEQVFAEAGGEEV